MNTVAVIQARMGSTRLPGKMMLPLAGEHVLTHDVRRVSRSSVDEVVVATTATTADDIVERYAERAGATVFRGSERDVLGRMYGAADETDADVVVRLTGDCPLIDPETIDRVVAPVENGRCDYSANILDRTFPRGLDVEAFSMASFERVESEATSDGDREHVTPFYRRHPDRFELHNVTSDEVFSSNTFRDRTDLRFTLDEADDYELLRNVYENVRFEEVMPVTEAIEYVDANDLAGLNRNVEQKEVS